jgi:hypothetical protein
MTPADQQTLIEVLQSERPWRSDHRRPRRPGLGSGRDPGRVSAAAAATGLHSDLPDVIEYAVQCRHQLEPPETGTLH